LQLEEILNSLVKGVEKVPSLGNLAMGSTICGEGLS
jgi:hypothetical protein